MTAELAHHVSVIMAFAGGLCIGALITRLLRRDDR